MPDFFNFVKKVSPNARMGLHLIKIPKELPLELYKRFKANGAKGADKRYCPVSRKVAEQVLGDPAEEGNYIMTVTLNDCEYVFTIQANGEEVYYV